MLVISSWLSVIQFVEEEEEGLVWGVYTAKLPVSRWLRKVTKWR